MSVNFDSQNRIETVDSDSGQPSASKLLVCGKTPEIYLLSTLVSLLAGAEGAVRDFSVESPGDSEELGVTDLLAYLAVTDSEEFEEAFTDSYFSLIRVLLMDSEYALLESSLRSSSPFSLLESVFGLLPRALSVQFEEGELWSFGRESSKGLNAVRELLKRFKVLVGSEDLATLLTDLDSSLSSLALFFGVLENYRASRTISGESPAVKSCAHHEARLQQYALAFSLAVSDVIDGAAQIYALSISADRKTANSENVAVARSAFIDTIFPA